MISFEDSKKVEITVGKIISAEKIPETDKLLKLSVDFGINTNYESDTNIRMEVDKEGKKEEKRDIRQIVSGISLYFPDPSLLVGKKCMFVTNLEPRVIKGFESNGMLFAVSTDDGKFSLLEPSSEIPEGTKAK